MFRTWKYVLGDVDYPQIKLPKGAKILYFKYQNKVPCIWAYVDPEQPDEIRKFWIVETGQIMNIDPRFLYYVGSDMFETSAGPYVGHLYELTKQGKGNLIS